METLVALLMGGAPMKYAVAWTAGMLLANNCFYVPYLVLLIIYLCDRFAQPRGLTRLSDYLQLASIPAGCVGSPLPCQCFGCPCNMQRFLSKPQGHKEQLGYRGLGTILWPRQSVGIVLFFLLTTASLSTVSNFLVAAGPWTALAWLAGALVIFVLLCARRPP